MDVINKYYLFKEKKPRVVIPKKLAELLLNMQKYRQKGFTDITNLLLDFPQANRKMISDLLGKKFNSTSKKGTRDGFTAALTNFSRMGFSYHTTKDMKDFYKKCKEMYRQHKSELGVKRWAVIGRNVCDKKNYATFFIYDDDEL